MRVYVGQTRATRLIERLIDLNFGECTSRGELPARRAPWFYDNGAYGDFKAGRPFDAVAFREDVAEMAIKSAAGHPPDFVVAPDIVAGGVPSLEFSESWIAELHRDLPGRRIYLAVQDGMTALDVDRIVRRFDGIFVGGLTAWKIATGESWVRYAHAGGRACHIGRCGTRSRVAWARRIGADSIDSALPLWSEENLDTFLAGLCASQVELPLLPSEQVDPPGLAASEKG